jgi:hypothetical protein
LDSTGARLVTFIWILIVVIAFVLAPIIALKPRGKQSRIEKLRLLAREKGALYSVRRLPPLKTDAEKSSAMAVYTIASEEKLINQQEWILRRTLYAHDVNFFKEWDWANDQRPPESVQNFLLKRLMDLPKSVQAIAAGHAGIAIFWNEEDAQETLLELIDFLKHIRALYH